MKAGDKLYRVALPMVGPRLETAEVIGTTQGLRLMYFSDGCNEWVMRAFDDSRVEKQGWHTTPEGAVNEVLTKVKERHAKEIETYMQLLPTPPAAGSGRPETC